MSKLLTYNLDTFYGILPDSVQVAALTTVLRHGTHQGLPYSWLDLCDVSGPKWRIKPTLFSKKGIPARFSLFHHNTYGRRGWHAQGNTAWGTSEGLRDLICYVDQHETWEAAGRPETDPAMDFRKHVAAHAATHKPRFAARGATKGKPSLVFSGV